MKEVTAPYYHKWGGVPLHCIKCGAWYGLDDGHCVFKNTPSGPRQALEEAGADVPQEEE